MVDPKCCCDPRIHPEHLLPYTDSKTAGFRYQLVSRSCHLIYAEAIVWDQGTTPAPVVVKLFTNEDPGQTDTDVNIWNLTCGDTIPSNAWTPDHLQGVYCENGIFAEVQSTDASAKVIINMVYVNRLNYVHAFWRPSDFVTNYWQCSNGDDPLYNNYPPGNEGDDYSDTASSSTPDSGTGSPKGGVE